MLTGMSLATRPPLRARRGRTRGADAQEPARVPQGPPPARPPTLDVLASRWQLALDAAEHAVAVAGVALPAAEVRQQRRRLVEERRRTVDDLAALAAVMHAGPAPWLSPVPVTAAMLGLPTGVRACLFDLDGVLTDSGSLHAWAWGEVFDDFLLRLSEKTGWAFIPFDRERDYRTYLDGRPRLEGIHAFLSSRGIRVPEGGPADPPEAASAFALFRRKGETLARDLRRRPTAALPGARRYLEAAGRAGIGRAVVSASTSTAWMLELAGLDGLVEARVDAEAIQHERLRSRPAPDVVRAACDHLGVAPGDAVALTQSPAGVGAALAAGAAVVGVGEGERDELLRRFGAPRVVPSVAALLDRRLAEDGGRR
jgi:beta-phosphoglucomutase-like phosphatase (HAD superfamily)